MQSPLASRVFFLKVLKGKLGQSMQCLPAGERFSQVMVEEAEMVE